MPALSDYNSRDKYLPLHIFLQSLQIGSISSALFLSGELVVVLGLPDVRLVVPLLAGAGPPVPPLVHLVVAGLVVAVRP